MKKTLIATGLVMAIGISGQAMAEGPGSGWKAEKMADRQEYRDAKKQVRMNEVKGKVLNHMNERISVLQKGKACVKGANSRDELKACRNQVRENMPKKGEFKRAGA